MSEFYHRIDVTMSPGKTSGIGVKNGKYRFVGKGATPTEALKMAESFFDRHKDVVKPDSDLQPFHSGTKV